MLTAASLAVLLGALVRGGSDDAAGPPSSVGGTLIVAGGDSYDWAIPWKECTAGKALP